MRMHVIGCGGDGLGLSLRSQLVASLRFMGHEVVVTDGAGAGDDAARVGAALRRFGPDVVIHVPGSGALDGATVRQLTVEAEAVAVCLHRGPSCAAAATSLDHLSEDLHHYDLVAVPDRATFEEFQGEGTFRLSLLPPAVHVPELQAVVESERRGVVVMGDADPANVDLVLALSDIDEITVLGSGWDLVPVDAIVASAHDLVERGTVFAGARLAIELPSSLDHLTTVRRHHLELGLSDGVLEAAAVGTPSVVLDRPGVDELLLSGAEVITCASPGDLVALVPMLLAAPDDLALIGDAAWHRVTSEHTWAERWISLFGPWSDPHAMDDDEDVRRVGSQPTTATAGV